MTELTMEQCCNCGVEFGMPTVLVRARREDHRDFWCPNGHGQHYTAETEAEKMRRERDNARQQIARAEQEATEAQDELRRAERCEKNLKRKLAAGNCPCCKRSFANMAQHVRRQHPDFVAENVVRLKA